MAEHADFGAYKDALLVLGTAGVIVPFLHRYRISPVLSFMLAGALFSPSGLGKLTGFFPVLSSITISSPENINTIAELGVVFLLFLIGLELSYDRLLTMRKLVFGLGGLQVAISTFILATGTWLAGMHALSAVIIGAALSLSCTSIVIDRLAEQKRLATATGRTSFSILLFQDLAAVPLLLFLNLFDAGREGSLLSGMALALVQAIAMLLIIVGIGRFVLQPLFRIVAQTGDQDLFIATTIFVIVGTSLLTAMAGMSMALGAFVAGLMLAETEYRRATEATIEPLKSLLLGVFFFSVGLSIDPGIIAAEPLTLLATTVAHLSFQFLILYSLIRSFGFAKAAAIESAAMLAPSGEFTFVILTTAIAEKFIAPDIGNMLITSAAISMAFIPGLQWAGRRLGGYVTKPQEPDPELRAVPQGQMIKALVIGYGRVGQLIADMLSEHGVSYIAVDRDPRLVAQSRREGKPVYFGDVRQPDFLKHCGLDTAKAAIITIHTQSEIDQIVSTLRASYPHLIIVSRAKDASHARHLYDIGVNDAVPETIEASLQLSEAVLVGLGIPTGLVIASIHEKRDIFRAELQGAAKKAGTSTRAFPKRTSDS